MPDFFEQPILNNPYEEPRRCWELEPNGQPTQRILEKRRPSSYTSPIPKPRNVVTEPTQSNIDFVTEEGGEYEATLINEQINKIREEVRAWRRLPPDKWKAWPQDALIELEPMTP